MAFVDSGLKLIRAVATKANIGTQPIKANAQGTALLSKFNLPKETIESLFDAKLLPDGAVEGTFVRVGRNNSFNDDFVDILTFKDKDGKILGRIRDDLHFGAKTSKISTYSRPKLTTWNGDGDYVPKGLQETDIITKIFSNDRNTKEIRTIQQKLKTPTGKEFLTIGKVQRHNSEYNFTPETQSLYEYSKNSQPKGYSLATIRDSDGGVRVIDVKTEGIKINYDNPYLATYLYDRDEFI